MEELKVEILNAMPENHTHTKRYTDFKFAFVSISNTQVSGTSSAPLIYLLFYSDYIILPG